LEKRCITNVNVLEIHGQDARCANFGRLMDSGQAGLREKVIRVM